MYFRLNMESQAPKSNCKELFFDHLLTLEFTSRERNLTLSKPTPNYSFKTLCQCALHNVCVCVFFYLIWWQLSSGSRTPSWLYVLMWWQCPSEHFSDIRTGPHYNDNDFSKPLELSISPPSCIYGCHCTSGVTNSRTTAWYQCWVEVSFHPKCSVEAP
jgi:hypothetical protein